MHNAFTSTETLKHMKELINNSFDNQVNIHYYLNCHVY